MIEGLDIVARLRQIDEMPVCDEAADEIERLTEENERLMRCISGIEDELCREPPRVGDALFICEAAKATETKMPPDQQSESNGD